MAPLIQQEQSVVGQVLEKALVESLPLRGHNFMSYVTLARQTSPGRSERTRATRMGWGHKMLSEVRSFTPGGGGNKGFYMNG